MRIAIDARWIFPEDSGIGVYTRELITALSALDRDNEYMLLFSDDSMRRRVSDAAGIEGRANFACETVPYGLFSAAGQVFLPGLIRRRAIDVFHSPNYMIPLLAFPANGIGRTAAVITIHDVIPMIFPRHAPRSRKSRLFPLYRRLMLEVGKRATVIIADSDSSRRDIISHLHIPAHRTGRVRRVYCGVSAPPAGVVEPRPAKAAGDARTILYVGRSDPYKNCLGLLEAFALAGRQCPFPLRLVMAGSPDPRYPEIGARIAALGIGEVVRREYLSGADLESAYSTADLLALPSMYEGFGLPVVEAMARGTPVVCSNRGSLPEVAGDAAIQVDPEDSSALAAAFVRVLTTPALWHEMAAKGLRQSSLFTWKRTASETLAVYRDAAEMTGSGRK